MRMNPKKTETTLMGYWPLVLCLTVVLVTPVLLVVDKPEMEKIHELRVLSVDGAPLEIETAIKNPTLKDFPRHKIPALETRSMESNEDRTSPALSQTGSKPSELEIRTADWRYVGGILSSGKSVAMIERMETPNRKSPVTLGETLEGVAVAEISGSSILVRLEGNEREIPLTQGPAFEVEDVFIPEEVVEDPEIMAAVVYAQTLGRYVAEEPDFSSVGDEVETSGESLHELMDGIAGAASLISPFDSESMEDWGEAAAQEMSENPNDSLDPSQYPLTEEARLSLLGFERLMDR